MGTFPSRAIPFNGQYNQIKGSEMERSNWTCTGNIPIEGIPLVNTIRLKIDFAKWSDLIGTAWEISHGGHPISQDNKIRSIN
jgi:hypothetical protein